MPAYVIVDVKVTDPEQYQQYRVIRLLVPRNQLHLQPSGKARRRICRRLGVIGWAWHQFQTVAKRPPGGLVGEDCYGPLRAERIEGGEPACEEITSF